MERWYLYKQTYHQHPNNYWRSSDANAKGTAQRCDVHVENVDFHVAQDVQNVEDFVALHESQFVCYTKQMKRTMTDIWLNLMKDEDIHFLFVIEHILRYTLNIFASVSNVSYSPDSLVTGNAVKPDSINQSISYSPSNSFNKVELSVSCACQELMNVS